MQNSVGKAEARIAELTKLSEKDCRYIINDGIEIGVNIRKQQQACINFTGSLLQLSNNFNVPAAVCTLAVL
ncbi:hydantoinase B/oxoprolinase family protein [Candidatus Methylobacter favarea]|uniref:hydantoinase B/oxoprolinase family protein n=1 Tax=Candidatus Methylobacter favarea TaxID=2707345 RepID=UPI00157D4946|nr:hydantoinase B/oxoprolinase family protein [Candidatus Methylobacter favarea]